MNKCYFCGKEIEKNKTKSEHIIPNAVGGKLTSKSILCSDCNNNLSDIDQSLANSVYFLTNLFNPKRDNKTKSNLPIKFEYNGREFTREANGKYYSTKLNVEKQADGKYKLQLDALYSAENGAKEKALQPLLNAIDNLAKKFNWEQEKITKIKKETLQQFKNKVVDNYDAPIFMGRIHLNKDKKLFLAMLKIAIGYYLKNNNDFESIKGAIDILKHKNYSDSDKYCYYYFPSDFYPTDSIYHTLYLKGDNQSNCLYCLISIYGCINCLVLLNDNYKGKNFVHSYCYDLRNHKEIKLKKSITLTISEIKNILNNFPEDLHLKLKVCFDLFISFLVQREFKAEELFPIMQNNYRQVIKSGEMSSTNYAENFINNLITTMRNHEKFKYLYETQMVEIAKIGLLQFSYEYYLNDFCIPKILSEVVSQTIVDAIFKGQDLTTCINNMKLNLENYHNDIEEIQSHISKNIELYKNELENFIKDQYKKFEQANLLNNSYI